ncbi:MAG: hypothetical protein ACM3SY_12190 [Candidatus Omnitrophota bacterium]
MDSLKRMAIIIALIEKMAEEGSWCGETHIQKATYFLQALAKVPLEYEFVIYKHGPFSFDFKDELSEMFGGELITYFDRPYPYGPTLCPGESAENFLKKFPVTLNKFGPHINFIARHLGKKNVASLEKMGTALFMMLKNENKGVQELASDINKLKPHVTVEEAERALLAVQALMSAFNSIANSSNENTLICSTQ